MKTPRVGGSNDLLTGWPLSPQKAPVLTLSLEKPGTASPKLSLSLNKGARFTVKVEW